MNIELNFLPWRQEIRDRKKKQFFVALQIVAGLGVVAAGLLHLNYASIIETKESRVKYIKSQIIKIDGQIDQIEKLKTDKQNVISRMKVIKSLEHDRPIVVHMFDDLTRLMPNGVYIKKIDLSGDFLSIQGVATSNTRIAKLMRELKASQWFSHPKLISVSALEKDDSMSVLEQENYFELTVMRSSINIDSIINDNLEGDENEQ